MKHWQEHADQLHKLLCLLAFTDGSGRAIDADKGFRLWRKWAIQLRRRRRTIYLIGNGASASMASHFAADLAKNARLHTQVFSDLSLITAVSNDMGYEHVFAEPLRRRGEKGDMLVAISSSGRSPNILAAVGVARELGLTIVTLSAKDAANPLRACGGAATLNVYVPAATYGEAETCHAAILHWWMDLVQTESEESGA